MNLQDFEKWYEEVEGVDISKMSDFYFSKAKLHEICELFAEAQNKNEIKSDEKEN